MVSRFHALCDQRGGCMKVDKAHFALCEAVGQQLAILLLQRRASQNDGLSLLTVLKHALTQSLEPRFSVGVSQWGSGNHFPPIFLWVIVVGVFELPSRASGEQLADGRLADTAHTHQDQDHGLRPPNLSRYAHSPSPGFGIKKISSPSTRLQP